MPVKPADKRLQNYMARVFPNREQRLSAERQGIAARAAKAFNDLVSLENLVRGILINEPVPTTDHVRYYNFARALRRAIRVHAHDEGLPDAASALLRHHRTNGCREDVMRKIAESVFTAYLPEDKSREPAS